MSSPPLPIAPVTDAPIVPSSYRVILRKTVCTHCGDIGMTLESYALARIRTTDPRNSGHITHLIPVTEFRYNVPVSFTKGTDIPSPRCTECLAWDVKTGYSADLSHLPPPPPPPSTNLGATLVPLQNIASKYQIEPTKTASEARSEKRSGGATRGATRPRPSLSDLLADL